MDQSTHEVRLAQWRSIVERCQKRPEGQSARQWLSDHDIPEKQYYYWLRKIRALAYDEMQPVLPLSVTEQAPAPAVSFAEIPVDQFTGEDAGAPVPAVVIKTCKATIEISSAVSDEQMIKLVKAVAYAV